MLVINKNNFIVAVLILMAILTLSGCAANNVKTSNNKTVEIKEWKTKNGARVLYVYAAELPMVDIQAIFDAGSVRDEDKPGIANLTNGLLSHGAKLGNKKLTVDDISERFDSIGARFSAGASKDNASISLRTLTDEKWLTKAVNTMEAVISAPTFDNKELERVRKQLLISFEERKQSPDTIASEKFYKGLYHNHPYAMPGIGTEESIKKFSRKDLVRFYKKYYVAENALVTIVGDVDMAKAELLAEKIVGKLPSGIKAKSLPAVEELEATSFVHQEFPSTQTHIMMGQPGIHRKDKDYFTLYVANHILGGSGFGSRIMHEIREKRGLAYSSYSYFVPMSKRGPFMIGMQTSNKQTDEAIKVLKETLNEFVNNGPTEKELLHAKKNITGGFPLRIDSNSDISSYLSVIGFYDLPLSYLKDFNQRIEAVTLQQIKETLKRRINTEKMFTVTVGTRVN
ncbi:MAG: insulinase family protein [Gammaproteobacteria bacterium]|nr:insulinase family protein [Gammaproteobacteria bacterium]